jgi:hypothetical protein
MTPPPNSLPAPDTDGAATSLADDSAAVAVKVGAAETRGRVVTGVVALAAFAAAAVGVGFETVVGGGPKCAVALTTLAAAGVALAGAGTGATVAAAAGASV